MARPKGGGSLPAPFLDNELELDVALARQDNIDAAMAMKAKCDDLGAIVLECTNMEPYAADISRATGLPVFSIQDVDDLVPAQSGAEILCK